MKINYNLLTALAILSGFLFVGSVHAFNPQPEPPQGWPIGIATNQVAAINVGHPPDPILPTVPISVRVGIYEASGRLLGDRRLRVIPGQVVSLELSWRDLRIQDGERLTIYGVVQCLGNATSKQRCAQSITSSMELFDSDTGKTDIVVPIVPAVVPVFVNDVSDTDQ